MNGSFVSVIIINSKSEIKKANRSGNFLLEKSALIGRNEDQKIDFKVPDLQNRIDILWKSPNLDSELYRADDKTGVMHQILLSKIKGASRGRKDKLMSVTTFDMQAWGDDKVILATRLYNLTKSEAALASSLLIGRDLQVYADLCGASIATIRKHLANLYKKTSTNRQVELVNILSFGDLEADMLLSYSHSMV